MKPSACELTSSESPARRGRAAVAHQPPRLAHVARQHQPRVPAQRREDLLVLGEHREAHGRDEVARAPLRVGPQALARDAQLVERRAQRALGLPAQHLLGLGARGRRASPSSESTCASRPRAARQTSACGASSPALVTSSASAPASSAASATFGSSKLGRTSPAGSGSRPALRTANAPPRRSNWTTHAPSPDSPTAACGSRGEMSLWKGFIRSAGQQSACQ